MPSKWGVATQAIRIPAELVEDIFEMVNQRMQALKNAVLANPKNEWIEVPADQEDIEEMLAEEPNPVYEQAVAEFQAKVAATPEGQAHLAKVEEIKAQWQKLGLLDEEPTSNDALISAIQQQPQAEENINDWLLKQPGYEIETYILDEESGELLEQQPQPQEQSTVATKQSKQQAKRDRRLNQAKKSGALSGKGFAPKQDPVEVRNKTFYKRVSALFYKESMIAEENLRIFMKKVASSSVPNRYNLFEKVLTNIQEFLVVDLYCHGKCDRETINSYYDHKKYYHRKIAETFPSIVADNSIEAEFVSLVTDALDCWDYCYCELSSEDGEANYAYWIENGMV
jgi:hypothetical protein